MTEKTKINTITDIQMEQVQKRKDFIAAYIEILEGELIPYLSNQRLLPNLLKNKITSLEHSIELRFIFGFGWKIEGEISIDDMVDSTCFRDTFLSFWLGDSFREQIKYINYDLKRINNYTGYIITLFNHRDLLKDIFEGSTIKDQLIQLGESLGCRVEIKYDVNSKGEVIPIYKLNW